MVLARTDSFLLCGNPPLSSYSFPINAFEILINSQRLSHVYSVKGMALGGHVAGPLIKHLP